MDPLNLLKQQHAAAAAAQLTAQFPYLAHDQRNFQLYNPFAAFSQQQQQQQPQVSQYPFGNSPSQLLENLNPASAMASLLSRPLESLYAAALASAAANGSNSNSANSNQSFSLLSNAGVGLNGLNSIANNSLLLSQLAQSNNNNNNSLTNGSSSSSGDLKSRMSAVELAAIAAAASAAYPYNPFTSQLQQFQLQHNQQAK